jgi:transcriptional regulator with XRE-family HTH domain
VRIERGVYQHELAHAVGLSLSTIKRLEQGRAKNAPLWWYVNCAIALDVGLEDVLEPVDLRWYSRPSAPKPPGVDWLAERRQRADEWLAERRQSGRWAPTRDSQWRND